MSCMVKLSPPPWLASIPQLLLVPKKDIDPKTDNGPKTENDPKTEILPTPQAGRSLSPPSGCLGFLTPAASGPVWPKGQASLSIPAIKSDTFLRYDYTRSQIVYLDF